MSIFPTETSSFKMSSSAIFSKNLPKLQDDLSILSSTQSRTVIILPLCHVLCITYYWSLPNQVLMTWKARCGAVSFCLSCKSIEHDTEKTLKENFMDLEFSSLCQCILLGTSLNILYFLPWVLSFIYWQIYK